MKIFKYSFLALIAVVLITGCGEKNEETSNTNAKKNTPYELEITTEPLRIYDGEGNLLAEDELDITKGYTIEQDEKIIGIEIRTEGERKFLVVNGKKSGKAKLNVYQFSSESTTCTSKSSMTFKVDENLNVTFNNDISGQFGTCDEDISNVTIIK